MAKNENENASLRGIYILVYSTQEFLSQNTLLSDETELQNKIDGTYSIMCQVKNQLKFIMRQLSSV